MSEDYLIRNCAPTLAGIKTANLFSCPCPDLPVPTPAVGGGFAPWGGHADFESSGL